MTSKPLPPHGTTSRYRHHHCRCDLCREANRSYHRNRYHAIKAGTWQPYVSAEPVRQHILALLEAGFATNRIARLSGVSDWEIQIFLKHAKGHTRRRQTSPVTAAKILAVRPDTFLPGKVDATGTTRRIEALGTLGWPMAQIATRVGRSADGFTLIRRRRIVLATTAVATATAYDELRRLNPERHGVAKEIVTRTRNAAKANGWVPPKYWDKFPGAIDDPHFTPEYGLTKPQRLAEEAVWMVTVAGLPRTEAAARLGMTFSEVDEALALHRDSMRKAA